MTDKQNPVVKVGDKLIITYHGNRRNDYVVEEVEKITPKGLIKTKTYTLSSNLRIRGLDAWSRISSQAELATQERLTEIVQLNLENRCRDSLIRYEWRLLSGPIARKIHSTLATLLKEEQTQKESSNAQENK